MIADFILFPLLLFFVIRGYLRGGIRAFFSLLAVIISLVISFLGPNLMFFFTKYFFEDPTDPGMRFASQLLLYALIFIVLQTLGFVATGLMESIGLSTANKLIGLFFGILAGVAIGCVPCWIIFATPSLAHAPAITGIIDDSTFLSHYAPIARALMPKPRKKKKAAV